MEKIWKRIPDYSLYEASTDGEIKTFNWKNQGQERIMKPAMDACGYMRTMLKNDNGKTHTIKVHRIIAQTFIQNPENKCSVNHKNSIRNDNRLINLEWATKSENQLHSYKNNRHNAKGQFNSCASLLDEQVIEIRKNYQYGKTGKTGITKQQIAEKYNTSFHVIKRIILNKTWKHIL